MVKSDRGEIVLLLFVSYRNQQWAAWKFGRIVFENIAKVLKRFFRERDELTRVSYVVNMFTVDLIIWAFLFYPVVPEHIIFLIIYQI